MIQKKLGVYPFRYGNRIELIQSGIPFFDQLEKLIRNAKNEIHFQVYIFESDHTGNIIQNLLVEAAKRGVKIYMILDAFGSKNFNEIWQNKIRNAGIHLYFFSPLKFGNFLHLGLRLHHKVICVDGKYALVGGINISDNYSAYVQTKPWLDFALLTEGIIVEDLLKICRRTLNMVNAGIKKEKFKHLVETDKEHHPIIARVLQNNWLQTKFGITKQYRQKIRNADTQIIILASYFIPSVTLKRFLKKAAQRGVNVCIVLGAISDIGIVKHASEYFYSDMLKSGIKLYEWKESTLHAKIALVDHNWLTVGSYNLNNLSDFGSIECNLEVLDDAFFNTVHLRIQEIINEGCEILSLDQSKKRFGFLTTIFNGICYALLRLSFNLLFFFQGKNSRKYRA